MFIFKVKLSIGLGRVKKILLGEKILQDHMITQQYKVIHLELTKSNKKKSKRYNLIVLRNLVNYLCDNHHEDIFCTDDPMRGKFHLKKCGYSIIRVSLSWFPPKIKSLDVLIHPYV